MEEKVVGYVRV
ncbi:Protein of unknown function [Bacillus mycoides]|nr:Protein of unknown function [Bacillus mycoides]